MALICVAITANGQKKKQEPDTKGINAETLAKIQKSYKNTAEDKALRNAMSGIELNKLAQNSDNSTAFNTYFSNKVNSQAITDQKSSGRCWMFTGFNVLRANFAKKHQDTLAVEFSHDYLFFYDQLEKANLMLQGVIDHAAKPLDD